MRKDLIRPKFDWAAYHKCNWCGAEKSQPCRDDDDEIAWKVCTNRKKIEGYIEQIKTEEIRLLKEPKKTNCRFCGKEYFQQWENARVNACSSKDCRWRAQQIRNGGKEKQCPTCKRTYCTTSDKEFCSVACRKKYKTLPLKHKQLDLFGSYNRN